MFVFKGVFRNFAKFTGKHKCQSLFLNKVAGLRSATFLKKRLWHRCFPVNFAKFLKQLYSKNISDDCFCKNFSNYIGYIYIGYYTTSFLNFYTILHPFHHVWDSKGNLFKRY